jgi:hypothetical protein
MHNLNLLIAVVLFGTGVAGLVRFSERREVNPTRREEATSASV